MCLCGWRGGGGGGGFTTRPGKLRFSGVFNFCFYYGLVTVDEALLFTPDFYPTFIPIPTATSILHQITDSVPRSLYIMITKAMVVIHSFIEILLSAYTMLCRSILVTSVYELVLGIW